MYHLKCHFSRETFSAYLHLHDNVFCYSPYCFLICLSLALNISYYHFSFKVEYKYHVLFIINSDSSIISLCQCRKDVSVIWREKWSEYYLHKHRCWDLNRCWYFKGFLYELVTHMCRRVVAHNGFLMCLLYFQVLEKERLLHTKAWQLGPTA